MRRPPDCVVLVARTHWVVGAVILVSVGVIHWMTYRMPVFEFPPGTYLFAVGLGVLYLVAGALVWFGVPFVGTVLSRVCTLLYLPRPRMGSMIWETMNSPEFRAHFERRKGGE